MEADRIAAVLENHNIEDAFFGLKHLGGAQEKVTGQTVTRVTSRGKAMLISFDNDLTLFSHNQLYGVWMVRKRGDTVNTRRTLRVALHTEKHSALLFSASTIELLDVDGLATQPFLARLGPDALDSTLKPGELVKRLHEPAFRGRGLGGLYLDQQFLAGIGNYLRSEILHKAGLHYAKRPRDLDDKRLQRLAKASLDLTWRAYRHRGVTNSPARVKKLKAQGFTRSKYRFAVFAREGEPCYTCDTPIKRIDVASRRLYFCPECQH